MISRMVENSLPKGRPLAIDPEAKSSSPTKPAFVARPIGAPVYHGFVVLEDVNVDGFTWGAITDFEAEFCQAGDAFVIAPDGSRSGLVWEVSTKRYFEQLCQFDQDRWGVWAVSFPSPMTDRDSARKNLATVVPDLKARWEAWKRWLAESR
jgi:hypothetical protein